MNFTEVPEKINDRRITALPVDGVTSGVLDGVNVALDDGLDDVTPVTADTPLKPEVESVDVIVLKNELVVTAVATAATDDGEVPVTVVATISESVVLDEGHILLPGTSMPL